MDTYGIDGHSLAPTRSWRLTRIFDRAMPRKVVLWSNLLPLPANNSAPHCLSQRATSPPVDLCSTGHKQLKKQEKLAHCSLHAK